MRIAKAKDHWRRLRKENKGLRLGELVIRDHVSLQNQKVDFGEKRLAALCGLNGAGKSRIIHLLAGLACSATDFLSDAEVGEDCLLSLTLTTGDESDETILSRTELDELGAYIEPHLDSPRLLHYFRSEQNLEEVLQQFEFARWDSRQLEEANSVTLRKYAWVEVAELDPIETRESTGLFDPLTRGQIPFFRVKSGQAIYDSRGMGTGEFSALYLLWSIHYHSARVFLIEEPEAFLPPKSQAALMDILARHLVESGASALITTHSRHVLQRLQLEEVVVVGRREALRFPDHTRLLETWGLVDVVPPRIVTAVVEDFAASVFATCLVDAFSNTDRIQLDVRIGGSNGEIFKIVTALGSLKGENLAVGVLDGDQKNDVNKHKKSNIIRNGSCFLPGDAGPDSLLKDASYQNVSTFCEAFDASMDLVGTVLDSLESVEYHDWADQVAVALNLGVEEVLTASFAAWQQDPANRKAGEEFVNELRAVAERATA